ncbi:hypothetical protein CPR19088_GLDEOEPO_00847 [Companilactobacillus paralimentarius]
MKFIRNHWYDIGAILGIVVIVLTIVYWNRMGTLKRIAVLNFIVILWHMFEEYRLPGGEGAITNLAMQPSEKGNADRYPLNQNNAMWINVFAAYVLYLFPIIWPELIWLSFMPIVFGLLQVIVHAIVTPKKLHTWYSPGEFAVVLGHLPLGVYWFYYTVSHGLLNWLNVLCGILYLVGFIVIGMKKIGYGLLADPNSPYPFPKSEFERSGYAKRIREFNNNGSKPY